MTSLLCKVRRVECDFGELEVNHPRVPYTPTQHRLTLADVLLGIAQLLVFCALAAASAVCWMWSFAMVLKAVLS